MPSFPIIAALALVLCVFLLALWAREITRAERAETRAREAQRLADRRLQLYGPALDAERAQTASWRCRAIAAEARVARRQPAGRDARGRFAARG